MSQYKHVNSLTVILFVQAAFLFAIYFNIVAARQVLGFLCLTFVPGFAILRLLKADFDLTNKCLFAVGLSIAFLMFIGLSLNLLCLLFGFSQAFTLSSLIITTSVIVIVLLSLGKSNCSQSGFLVNKSKKYIFLATMLCFVLLACIAGTLLASSTAQNNLILLIMILAVAFLVGFLASHKKMLFSDFYPLILLVIAIVLLFHVSFFSNYIHGGDIFGEYSVFRITKQASYWNLAFPDKLYNMLSITILPTMYSDVLGIDGTWIFKIVYPLIFSLVPVGLYQLFKSKVSKEIALFSVFFFMSNSVFFTELVVLARQMVGELFYVLLFLTIFDKKLNGPSKWFLFVAFSFGIIVSHYAMSYIFLAFIFAFWLFNFVRRRKCAVTVSMIVLFSVMAFTWYVYTSSAVTFNELLRMIDHIRESFVSDFLNPQSRGSQVLQGTGLMETVGTFWHSVGRYIYYTTELLILFGVVGALLKKKLSFFDEEYNVMVFLNLALVLACIIVPNLATTFNMTRFYHVALFFLSPFCVIGGIDLLTLLSRRRVNAKHLCTFIVLVLLIPFFLFQTGFVYEVTGEESWSLPLSSYRFDDAKLVRMGVLRESEVSGARWLSAYQGVDNLVYADYSSWTLLTYGEVKNFLLSYSNEPVWSGLYVFVRSTVSFNSSNVDFKINETNIIYSNGPCETFEVP